MNYELFMGEALAEALGPRHARLVGVRVVAEFLTHRYVPNRHDDAGGDQFVELSPCPLGALQCRLAVAGADDHHGAGIGWRNIGAQRHVDRGILGAGRAQR